MNFDAQKFFIGLTDFFSILLPGAALIYLTKDWLALRAGMPAGFPVTGAEQALVFIFASYLAGHILFLLGSFLDDVLYDPLRKLTDSGQIDRLAKGKSLSPLTWRDIAKSHWLFGKNPDDAVMRAVAAKIRALRPLSADGAVNTYKWSKARLLKEFPEGSLLVQRFEAASKFFRTFVPALLVLALFFAFRGAGFSALACLVGIPPVLWRYVDQRFKATEQAYIHLLALEGLKADKPSNPPREDGLSHSGAVVYRSDREIGRQYLLVQATGKPGEWVLPKGHIEPGEQPRQTAVREVREETGHWAGFRGWLGYAPLSKAKGAPMVAWFLLEQIEEGQGQPAEARQHQWLPLREAVAKATFRESKALLEQADKAIDD
jgi:8-oxo-dGTP pyrophosphatase MutT (NUDIX family)